MEALRALGQQLLAIWEQLGISQRVTVVLSGLALVTALGFIVFYTSRGDYALLFGRLGPEEAGKVVQSLDEQSIPYKVGEGGGSIFVPRDVVHKTRMTLASEGIPKSGGVGYELFDKPTFGQSDMAQRVNRLRAVQGELARSINEMEGVESSRVMVVMQVVLAEPGLPGGLLVCWGLLAGVCAAFSKEGGLALPRNCRFGIHCLLACSLYSMILQVGHYANQGFGDVQGGQCCACKILSLAIHCMQNHGSLVSIK